MSETVGSHPPHPDIDVFHESPPRRLRRLPGLTPFRSHLGRRFRQARIHEWFESWRRAVRYTRARSLAEAIAFVVIGFSLDDLHVLRMPGFIVGIAAALVVLIFGGLLHGAAMANRSRGLGLKEEQEYFERGRSVGRTALFVVAVCTFVWLVFFTAGVPPWAV